MANSTEKRSGHVVPLVGWAAVTAALIVALHVAGGGALAPPPLTSPSEWTAWLDGRHPVIAAFALGRVVALAAAWYMVAVTVLGVVARALSRDRLAAAVDRLTLPVLRRLVVGMMGVSLGTGSLTAALAVEDPPPATATTTTVTVAGARGSPPSTVTMHRLPPAESTPPPQGTEGRTWTVRPGDCFWSIAEAVVAGEIGHQPEPGEVVPYWERLIAANRPALADPANDDLIFPGQVFTLPAP